MFQSDDFDDEDFFNEILETDKSNNQNEFIFNPVTTNSNGNNNNEDFHFREPTTSRSNDNIINLFTKPQNITNTGIFQSKSPNKHRKVVQRKFPGPAGLLPNKKIDINLKNLEENEVSVNKTLVPDEIICSQISSNCFHESPWIDMCKDFYINEKKLSLPDKYSISWAKNKAMSKQLLGQKTPFLAAIITHIDYSNKNPMVNLKDPTGEMSGAIHHEVWEEFSEKLNVGSVLVLQQVGVLITLKKYYLNITSNNIITIYHYREPLTQISQNLTQTLRKSLEVMSVKKISAEEISNSIDNFRKNFIEKNLINNSLADNDNPFFKHNLSNIPNNTSLLSPQASASIVQASRQSVNKNVFKRPKNFIPNQTMESNTMVSIKNQNINPDFVICEKNPSKECNFNSQYQNRSNFAQNGTNLAKNKSNWTQNQSNITQNNSQFQNQSNVVQKDSQIQNQSSWAQSCSNLDPKGLQNSFKFHSFMKNKDIENSNKVTHNSLEGQKNYSNIPNTSNGIQKGFEASEDSLKSCKRPKLDLESEFSNDFISETPEFLENNITHKIFNYEKNSVQSVQIQIGGQNLEKAMNFGPKVDSLPCSIISETPETIEKKLEQNFNVKNLAVNFKSNQNDEFGMKDYISGTPEVIGKLTRFDTNIRPSSTKNIVKSIFNSSDSSAMEHNHVKKSNNFKFINNQCKPKESVCDNNMETKSRVDDNNKNIFFNDNFVEGLDESFFEDF